MQVNLLKSYVLHSVHCIDFSHVTSKCGMGWDDDDYQWLGSASGIHWKSKNKQQRIKLKEMNLAGMNQVEGWILTYKLDKLIS